MHLAFLCAFLLSRRSLVLARVSSRAIGILVFVQRTLGLYTTFCSDYCLNSKARLLSEVNMADFVKCWIFLTLRNSFFLYFAGP